MNGKSDKMEPVAIAIDFIEDSEDICLTGIDLDTSRRVRVSITRTSDCASDLSSALQPKTGLVLTLSIQALEALN